MVEKGDTLTVEIDHIGSSGIPIANIPGDQHNLIVYGGEPGDRVDIDVNKTETGVFVGELRDPSPTQKSLAEEQRAKRKRTRKKKREDRHKEHHETSSEEWKGTNKNSLINGHL